MTCSDDNTYTYTYNLRTIDYEIRDGVLWYLHEESWTKPDGKLIHVNVAWSDKRIKTMHELLEDMGLRQDCNCRECT